MIVGSGRLRLSWVSILGLFFVLVSIIAGLIFTHQGLPDGFLHPYSLGRISILIIVIVSSAYLCFFFRGSKSLESFFWRYILFGMILNTIGSTMSSIVASNDSQHIIPISISSNILFIITYIYLCTALIIEIIHLNKLKTTKVNRLKVILYPLIASIVSLIVLFIIYWLLPSAFSSNPKNITVISSYIFIFFDMATLILSTILLVSSYRSELFGIYGSLSFAMLSISTFHIIKLFAKLYNSPLPIHLNILRIITMFFIVPAIDGRMNFNKQETEIKNILFK
jgi:hypothetical protein